MSEGLRSFEIIWREETVANTKYLDFKIYGFMRELGLDGPALLVYALIYAFTAGERGYYYGSYKRIADSAGVSLRTVYKYVGRLTELGLIEEFCPADACVGGIRCTDLAKREDYIKPKGAEEGFAEPTDVGGEMLLRARYADESGDCAGEYTPYCRVESDECMPCESGLSREGAAPVEGIRDDFCEADDDGLRSALQKYALPHRFDEDKADERRERITLPKYRVIAVGRTGEVTLEVKQFERLKSLVSPERLYYYVRRLEKHIESGGARPFSCYRTILRWIEADLGTR